MKNQIKENLLNEYEEFLMTENIEVPTELKRRVFIKIGHLIKPKAVFVFCKVLAIHLIVGFFSLSICHQFGMNPFRTEFSLEEWFMRSGGFGICMFACGTLFVSLSLMTAGYFLTIEEVRALRRTALLQSLSLGIISLGLFTAFGIEMAATIAALWLAGGLVGGLLTTETVWRLRNA